MTPTFIGFAVFLLGCWLFIRHGIFALFCATIAFGLLEGSAAFVLPALGNSSIPPGRLMLGFLLLATFFAIKDRALLAKEAFVENAWLIAFCFYGVLSAFFLPRIFEGQIDVVPLRSSGLRHLFDAYPLAFSSQNITTSIYLVGTGLVACCGYVAVRQTCDITPIIKLAVAITLGHAAIGILGVVLRGTPWDAVVEFFRNGSYSQLEQSTKSFVRISGFMPEASNYARFGIVWMIFTFELWLRHVKPWSTGIAAAVMFGTLLLSTSSTAYVGIAAYAVVLLARFALIPSYLRSDKVISLVAVALLGLVALLAALIFSSSAAQEFETMLRQMTVEKADSLSGQQRAFWALQGFEAFKISYGLGIGAGSFRSSSIIMAILGGMGITGTLFFAAYLLKIMWPFGARLDREASGALEYKVAASAAWCAFAGLLPAMAMQPSPDPGMEFAAFAGLALALRNRLLASDKTSANGTASNDLNSLPRMFGNRAIKPQDVPQAGWRHVSR
jgi:hypothetical protein